MLGEFNAFEWDEESTKLYRNHKATTDELITLMGDLKVLSKMDFKQLLRWRIKMREFRSKLLEGTDAASSEEEEEEEEEEDEEEDQEDEGNIDRYLRSMHMRYEYMDIDTIILNPFFLFL